MSSDSDRKPSNIMNEYTSSENGDCILHLWEGFSALPSSDDEQSSEGDALNQATTDESSSDTVIKKDSPPPKSLKKTNNAMTTPPDQMLSSKNRKSLVNSCRTNYFASLSDEMVLLVFAWLPQRQLPNCALVCHRWRQIAYDESLWQRLDVSGIAFRPDYMGQVFLRNPIILRIAQAEIPSPLFGELAPAMEGYICQVQYLDLSMAIIAANELAELLGKTKHLKKLSVEHCSTDESVCCSIASNHDLEVLNMSQCYELNAPGLEEILINCSELQELNLAWTDLSRKCIDIVCKLVNENIKKLNLSGGLKITQDCNVSELVSRCTCLTELDLSDCTDLTEKCLDDIVENLHDVEQLSFSRCYNISPIQYFKFIHIKTLKILNIFGLMQPSQLETLQGNFKKVKLNEKKFSTIARPTVGERRSSIWGLRVRC